MKETFKLKFYKQNYIMYVLGFTLIQGLSIQSEAAVTVRSD